MAADPDAAAGHHRVGRGDIPRSVRLAYGSRNRHRAQRRADHRASAQPGHAAAARHPEPRAMNFIEAPSPNFDVRTAPPEILVLHYTGMKTGPEALERLRDPAAKVSSHYMVEEDGRVFRLVAEERTAWHAGVSY